MGLAKGWPARWQTRDLSEPVSSVSKRLGTGSMSGRENSEFKPLGGPSIVLSAPIELQKTPHAREFRTILQRIRIIRDCVAERGGFEPPVPRGLLWAEIRPEFGALFGPTKSNRAGQNLFALGFGFASALPGSLRSPRLNADARRRRGSGQSFRFKPEGRRRPSR